MAVREWFSHAKEVWQSFNKDYGLLLAAAVSFYTFLSLFPLLLVLVGVLGFILGSPTHAEALLSRILGSVVVGPQALAIIREVIHGRNAAAGIGVIVLLWSGTSAFVVLEQAMNLAWRTEDTRSHIKRRGIALLMLLVGGALTALSLGTTAALHAIAASKFASDISPLLRLLAYPVPAIASIMLFALMYKLLPYARVTWRTALVGGVFAGVLWEAAKHVFTFYVVHWASYNKIYGSLGSVILLMVWIDYSAIITILGAEYASAWAKRRRQRRHA